MHILISAHPEGSDIVVHELDAAGFQTSSHPLESMVATIETVARSGGRIDAALLAGSTSEILPIVAKIRLLDERLTFKGAVRARTMPCVLDGPVTQPWGGRTVQIGGSGRTNRMLEALAPGAAELPKWTTIVRVNEAWSESLIRAISDWRQSLLEELDYVGFTVTEGPSGQIDVSHALQRRRRDSEILAPDGTPGALRANQYLILAPDFLENVGVYAELKYLIENYVAIAQSEGIKPETVFQRFFEQNPHLVKRNLFQAMWAKPQLRRPEAPGRHYSPDFVLKPIVGAHMGTNWEILDLKLPGDSLMRASAFHPSYSAKLTAAMQQLRNYRDYFSRHDTRDELVSRFGYQPTHPRIAILMGRRRAEENLAEAQGVSGDLDIDVITYDDVVEFEANRLVLDATIAGLFTK